ncbi:trypsin-like serine protease [Dictyobacter aurantiacus]|uniref:Peptidase S1 domain-containing protein n=1 Tax=Dictyobacter aurantiacus TaxID=1936993 RepID=A0A401ZKQ2_9CHLR|nr:trypsin-like serine protease [Dictyobacter aurantiacus]GCE07426.1 hypothetical protein KDAU_47550 [Dictyobacter aurantiacus]
MIIRHDRSDRESLVDAAQWPGITSFFRGHSAASLIAPTWLLTAAHVAVSIPTDHPLSVELGGARYRLGRVVIHPDFRHEWTTESELAGGTVDLALVGLAAPVEGIDPFALYEHDDELGQEVLMLGSGECGNGRRGAMGSDRHLRRATNRVDEVDEYCLKMGFEAPPLGTELEGVCGRGDSGGPAFIRRDSRLYLAGVSSWQRLDGRPLGTYSCVEHFARVSRYINWITTMINGG